MAISRRDFAKRSAVTGAGVTIAGSAGVLASAPGALAGVRDGSANGDGNGSVDGSGGGRGHRPELGYGPLVPDPDGILALPEGFSYQILTHSGVTKLESGEVTPSNHDGTATFEGRRGATLLVNNHELSGPRSDWEHPVPLAEGLVYDPAAPGGCTVVEVSKHGDHVTEWVGIAGTAQNCAGGSTPWGTWLTCEETTDRAGENGMTKDHGYVFEVDPYDHRANRDPRPVKALGRFDHEAVVVDRRRGHFYLTEDADSPNGLFYRWVPPRDFRQGRGELRGLAEDAGKLQAMKCFDSGGAFVEDLSFTARTGAVYGVDWVDVPDRDARETPVREQFQNDEVTRARKLEGMWWGDGGAYFVSSYARAEDSPGEPHDGQVWFYDPKRRTVTLKVLLGVNRDPSEPGGLDGPDNITVSPYGGLILAEDGEGHQHLFGAADSGETYPLARNELNLGTEEEPDYSEFAGVCFSQDGRTLFANIQTPGILLAITGPWRRVPRR